MHNVCSGQTGIRTPDIVVEYFNLHEEVLRWMAFPIANKNNPKTFLPPQEAREKVNNHHQPSHKNFVSVIPDT